MADRCVFCQIVAGAASASVVYEDGAALRTSGLRREGVNPFLADGEAAFREVFHAHLRVFPRFAGDAFKIDADRSVSPTREAPDAATAEIARALAAS